ncbi:MAG TPA: transglutaminase-like cysteine peptidase [Burkholderiales bacterium]|nr:transglutaminase-like cysteine peptidase [Burkholderiales bacterium]
MRVEDAREPQTLRWAPWIVPCAVLLAAALGAAGEPGFSRSITPGLVAAYNAHFGRGAQGRLEGWQGFVRRTGAPATEAGLLSPVNRFVNRVPSETDQDHWGVEDYWATPAETFASNGGDCEDYAIAKYFTLKELGIPVARLRLVYARAQFSGDAHLVLAYYATPGAEPMILDNLESDIKPASDRPDLTPVYTFNDEDMQMTQRNAPSIRLSPTTNRKWASVLDKLQRELTF